jgi:hypothetical protein
MQNTQHNPQATHYADVYPGKYFTQHIPFGSLRSVTGEEEVAQAF